MKKIFAIACLALTLFVSSVSAAPDLVNSSHDTVFSLPADAPVVYSATIVPYVTDSFDVPAIDVADSADSAGDSCPLFSPLDLPRPKHFFSYSMASERVYKHNFSVTISRFSKNVKEHPGWRVPGGHKFRFGSCV